MVLNPSALRADAGISPRRATFLFEQPKRKAKKLPLLSASLRFASGNLRCSGMGCAAKLLTRCALQSNSCRESDHEVWALYGAQTQPRPCAPRRWQKGDGQPDIQRSARAAVFKQARCIFKCFRPLALTHRALPAINLIEAVAKL